MAPAVIAGLGNPGSEYADTRHNVGRHVLAAFAARLNANFAGGATAVRAAHGGRTLWLLKPCVYMNESGRGIAPHLRYHRIPAGNLLVIHDDITLEPGTMKLSTGGGDGGHNGIASILQNLPNTFARLRIGIGGKHYPGQDLAAHVLGKLSPEELAIHAARLDNYLNAVEIWLAQGTALAQNQINKKTKTPIQQTTPTISPATT
ncbi:MAG: aminoacyl-tRNA hydrolase [Puniceicoccales bacterium]|jgi:PTH1 family peptidyl-tRNA hydrolase|nr:aminoacyl-tRNA hydrolase [Puniceicoccales bacterium]